MSAQAEQAGLAYGEAGPDPVSDESNSPWRDTTENIEFGIMSDGVVGEWYVS